MPAEEKKVVPTMIRRIERVKEKVGLSRSQIYQLVAKGRFPRPVRLGPRSVGWVEADLEKWLQNRIAEPYVPIPVCKPSAAASKRRRGGAI